MKVKRFNNDQEVFTHFENLETNMQSILVPKSKDDEITRKVLIINNLGTHSGIVGVSDENSLFEIKRIQENIPNRILWENICREIAVESSVEIISVDKQYMVIFKIIYLI